MIFLHSLSLKAKNYTLFNPKWESKMIVFSSIAAKSWLSLCFIYIFRVESRCPSVGVE